MGNDKHAGHLQKEFWLSIAGLMAQTKPTKKATRIWPATSF